jgi:hypothetical protein
MGGKPASKTLLESQSVAFTGVFTRVCVYCVSCVYCAVYVNISKCEDNDTSLGAKVRTFKRIWAEVERVFNGVDHNGAILNASECVVPCINPPDDLKAFCQEEDITVRDAAQDATVALLVVPIGTRNGIKEAIYAKVTSWISGFARL